SGAKYVVFDFEAQAVGSQGYVFVAESKSFVAFKQIVGAIRRAEDDALCRRRLVEKVNIDAVGPNPHLCLSRRRLRRRSRLRRRVTDYVDLGIEIERNGQREAGSLLLVIEEHTIRIAKRQPWELISVIEHAQMLRRT